MAVKQKGEILTFDRVLAALKGKQIEENGNMTFEISDELIAALNEHRQFHKAYKDAGQAVDDCREKIKSMIALQYKVPSYLVESILMDILYR